VQVMGWGADGTRTVIDRFDLYKPPAESGGDDPDRALSPAKYPADWRVLETLSTKVWAVMGQEYGLLAMAVAVDFQGEPGVSDNAEEFWRGRRKAGEGSRWFLTRGQGGFHQRDRIWHEAPGRSNKGKKGRAIKLLNMATDRLKDSVTAALVRPGDTPRSFPLPEFLGEDHLAEFCAEERTAKGWVPKPGQKRNESLDLSVQAQALAEHKGLRRINPEAPPNWATVGEGNPYWVPLECRDDESAPARGAPKKRKRRIGKVRI